MLQNYEGIIPNVHLDACTREQLQAAYPDRSAAPKPLVLTCYDLRALSWVANPPLNAASVMGQHCSSSLHDYHMAAADTYMSNTPLFGAVWLH